MPTAVLSLQWKGEVSDWTFCLLAQVKVTSTLEDSGVTDRQNNTNSPNTGRIIVRCWSDENWGISCARDTRKEVRGMRNANFGWTGRDCLASLRSPFKNCNVGPFGWQSLSYSFLWLCLSCCTSVTSQMKASVSIFNGCGAIYLLNKVILTSVDEILKWNPFIEGHWAVLSCCAVLCSPNWFKLFSPC